MRTGAAYGHVGNFHEAGFYGSDGEFLDLIVPFVTEGLANDEPVLIGYDTRKCDLLREALPQPSGVHFLVDKTLYSTPARAIEAYRRQFDRYLATGAQQIRIAGDVPHEGNGGRFAGWDRYEAAVNTVWQRYPVWSRCLYDVTTASDDVRDVVERTHPRLATADGEATVSGRYEEIEAFQPLPPGLDPLETRAPAARLVDASPEQVRNVVGFHALARIGTTALDDLLFGVTEAVTNAGLYGERPTTVSVWAGPRRVVVRVHDNGGGPTDPLAGLVPATDGKSAAGLGLWLTHQLPHVDVTLIRGDAGFAVRLRSGQLPGQATPPAERVAPRAGTERGAPPGRADVHAIDGDGSSFCGTVDPANLVELDGLLWPDVDRDQRCARCQATLHAYGIGFL